MTTKKKAPKDKPSAPPAEKKAPASKPPTNPFLKTHPSNVFRPGSRTGHRGG